MNHIEFLVQGSSVIPYKVTFNKVRNNITALCDCPAGINNMHCKHRINILYGCIDNIVSGNEDDVLIVGNWLPGSDVEEALAQVKNAEDYLKVAQKRLRDYKKKLARVLID